MLHYFVSEETIIEVGGNGKSGICNAISIHRSMCANSLDSSVHE